MAYSKVAIEKEIKDSLEFIDTFYKKKIHNYTGKATKTNEYYSEIIATAILNSLSHFEKIKKITRNSKGKSYSTKSHHNGTSSINYESKRHEENYVKKLFNEKITHDHLGQIIDFQIPLKDGKSDKAGKFDIMSFHGDTLYLIELKYGDNQETLLRAILEVHTYCKIIDHIKLTNDFKHLLPDNGYVIRPAVMVVNDPKKKACKSFVELEELERGERVNLKELAKEFKITFFKSADGKKFEIIKF